MVHFWFLKIGPKMDPKRDPKSDPKKDPKIDPQRDPLKSQKCCNYNVFGNLGPPFRLLLGLPFEAKSGPSGGSNLSPFSGSENGRNHCIYNVWEAFRAPNGKPLFGARNGPLRASN